jgi:hypothetical protein
MRQSAQQFQASFGNSKILWGLRDNLVEKSSDNWSGMAIDTYNGMMAAPVNTRKTRGRA